MRDNCGLCGTPDCICTGSPPDAPKHNSIYWETRALRAEAQLAATEEGKNDWRILAHNLEAQLDAVRDACSDRGDKT